MSDLVSKISASGLSAGIFLVWWPAHVASQGGDALLARGVLWAAAFELLLLGFRPLERALGRAVRERRADALALRSIGRVLLLAVVAGAVPVVLLSGTHGSIVPPARAAAPKVIVKREIVRREVVVRRVRHVVRVPVPVAAAPATTAAASAAPARTAATPPTTPTAKRTAATAATKTTAAATAPAATSSDTKTDLSSSAATTAEPAATASASQPSTSAAAAPATAAAPASPAPATAPSGH